MKFTSETATNGVTERRFELDVAGDIVSGALWAPESAEGPRPLLLIGHGGGQNTLFPPLVAGANHYAGALGYAVMAIDAPGHGPRATPEWSARFASAFRGGMGSEAVRLMAELASRAAPEWKAALTAVQALPFVGTSGPVGYMGASLGAQLGLPFVAGEPRITAAAFGLAGLHADGPALGEAARKLTVPVEFAMQWDDELVPRDTAIALFEAIGSKEKTLHANPGGHGAMPPFERAGWLSFFARHFQMSNSMPAERRGSTTPHQKGPPMKFICLAYYDEKAFKALPKNEVEAIVSQCPAHDDALRATGALLVHASLGKPVESVSIRPRQGKIEVTDGPFAEAKELVGGFFMIEAEDMEAAVVIASKHPAAHLGEHVGWGIEVRPVGYCEGP